jgi:16S rRNA (cytidine1402-2'-O)-methyltransferase
MKGILTLVPTPIDDESPLCSVATAKLQKAHEDGDIILVEEAKPGRRRWLHYGLPREAIENFVLYNEHTFKEVGDEVIAALKNGKNAFLMSDCGLPAFCDPGRRLVERCHYSKIKVTSTPFANSISLAVSLSGFPHDRFVFEGFVPVNSEKRAKALKRIMNSSDVSILMDTPYRLKKMLEELAKLDGEREAFVGLDLNHATEELMRDKLTKLNNKVDKSKREFVLVVGPKK